MHVMATGALHLAADEIHRNAARGVRATCFSEIPPYLGLPSIHSGEWDPFFAACEETGVVVNMHIGSSSKMPSTSADAPPVPCLIPRNFSPSASAALRMRTTRTGAPRVRGESAALQGRVQP